MDNTLPENVLPPDIILILGAIVAGGLILLLFIPMLISYWRLTRTSLLATHEAYEANTGGRQPWEALGVLLGLIALDGFVIVTNNHFLNLPPLILYPLLIGVNGFFLFFALDGLLVQVISKARKWYLERKIRY